MNTYPPEPMTIEELISLLTKELNERKEKAAAHKDVDNDKVIYVDFLNRKEL